MEMLTHRIPMVHEFPSTTSDGYQTIYAGGWDVFVSKLNPSGTGLVYSTYLGGNQPDYGYGVAVDGDGNAYMKPIPRNFPTTWCIPNQPCRRLRMLAKFRTVDRAECDCF